MTVCTTTVVVEVLRVLKHVPAKDLASLPNEAGAYVITVRSGARYVGSSKTLRSRVLAHRDAKDPNVTEPIASVCAYLSHSHVDARILEAWLIREVRPELNRARGMETGGRSRCSRACKVWDTPRPVEIAVGVAEDTGEIAPDATDKVPDGPGAYVITTMSDKKYIGSSMSSLRARVRSHLDPRHDSHVTEPVRSIRCRATACREDAVIAEYALIRELRPELNREFRPDASTWKKGSVNALFSDSSISLRHAFDTLGARIRALPGVKEVARRTWVTYQVSALKNFCAVRVLSDSLQIDIKEGRCRIHDPTGISEAIKPTQAWNFHRRVRVTDTTQVEVVFDLVKQAYEAMKRQG